MTEIVIQGLTIGGDPVVRFVLEHGLDPEVEAARRGWQVAGVRHAYAEAGADRVVIQLSVVAGLGDEIAEPDGPASGADGPARGNLPRPAVGPGVPAAGAGVPATDSGAAIAGPEVPATSAEAPAQGGEAPAQGGDGRVREVVPEGVTPRRKQRLAAYAVIARDGRLLLTQLSEVVRRSAGLWTLPGGGVDAGEDPAIGVRREVWEETGQHVGEVHLMDLLTYHWIGESPTGEWEDYQVVRLIYTATVPVPGLLVVHDVGGTTAGAAWLDPRALPEQERVAMLRGRRWSQWVQVAQGRRHL